jgi:hypothetical protein
VRSVSYVFIIVITALFILSGCDLYSRKTVNICLPSKPMVRSWILEYPVSFVDGLPVYEREIVTVKNAGEVTETIVRIARGVNLPLLAWPDYEVPAGDTGFRIKGNFPAGGIYPADMEAGRLFMNFEDGFACELIYSCMLNTDAVTAFDTCRFRRSISEKAAELADDPDSPLQGGCWMFDPEAIICRLGYGLFRESSIKTAQTMDFTVQVSAGGFFLSDNPFYPSVEAVDSPYGSVLEVIVPINRKTSFFNPLSGEAIEVFFDNKRWCWSNRLSGASESGRR